jgi:eukaryotic-like serine/threonine-protein kinase
MADDGSPPRRTRLYGAIDPVFVHSLGGPPTMAETSQHAVVPEPAIGERFARYQVHEVLGRGGMGEVLSVRDDQIGRLVAVKRLRVADPPSAMVARFLREARIQGRLEHPAVVPVHELQYEPGGQPFFVMKQLTGTTLADVVPRLANGDVRAAEQFPRQRLLRAFADVCLAIEFAHTRGVVHRDLKPANIMLGDFGEVYVLDWGIARLGGGDDDRSSFIDIEPLVDGATMAGAILGTPGYISPEQIRGDGDLDGRADVYALGCILFEVLALDGLHPPGQSALSSALVGIDARPSRRAPHREIPPELDAICMRATALDRAQRFATARALGDAVQRFLDGNRDLTLRKQLAADELATARSALRASDSPEARRDAMRAAARALALDPASREPAALVGALMLQAPTAAPPEVERELDELDLRSLRTSARFGTLAAVAYLAFLPLLYWIGFRDLGPLVVGAVVSILIVIAELVIAPRNAFVSGYIAIVGNLLMFALYAWMVSPAIFGPGPPILMITLLVAHRRLIPPWLLASLAVAATLAPWVWQVVDHVAPIAASAGDLTIHTMATVLEPRATLIVLVAYFVALTALATLLSVSQQDEQREVRRAIQLQSWQLRQLVPRE